MDNSVFLSVVIPAYNRAHLIENTLNSVLDQTCDDFEIIIIDDGSTDDTEAVVKPYLSEKIRYFKIPNSERGAARNRGTEKATGRYVNWVDSDDLLLPDHVKTIRTSADLHPDAEVLVFDFNNYYPESGTYTPSKIAPSLIQKSKKYIIKGNFFTCNGVIVKRETALRYPFSEIRELSASEDYELWLRLASDFKITGIDVITSTIVHHDERSVYSMVQVEKLESRFLEFIRLASQNPDVAQFLGKDRRYFIMRNYLLLAVDLAFNRHRRLAFHYLVKAFFQSERAMTQKVFWATVKHLLR